MDQGPRAVRRSSRVHERAAAEAWPHVRRHGWLHAWLLARLHRRVAGLLITIVIAAPLPSLAAERISAITVTGATRVAPASVMAVSGVKQGALYSDAMAADAIKALYATGQYSNVSLRQTAGRLEIAVSEAPLVGAIKIQGNSAIETKALEPALVLKANAPYSAAKAQASERALLALYARLGRSGTRVASESRERAPGVVDVVVTITEGAIDKVQEIRFQGRTAFSDAELASAIRTARSSWLDVLKSDAFYDPERLETDRALLLKFYRDRGYADAKIVSAVGAYDAGLAGYVVTFTIDEGPRFVVTQERVESALPGVSEALLASLVDRQAGKPVDVTRAEKTARAMTLALVKEGHGFASVKATFERDSAQGTVSILYRAEEMARVAIGKITVTGNARTSEVVIRRAMKLDEGGPAHPLLIERATNRVRALGIFKSVRIVPEKGASDDVVDLVAAVEEDETRIVGFGVGYSQNEGVVGDVSLEERNLMGLGQRAKLKLAGSLRRLDAEAGFTEPNLMGTDLAAGFDVFYKDLDRAREQSFKSRRVGGDVRLGYALSDEWSGEVKYTLSKNTLYDVGEAASAAIKEAAGSSEAKSYLTSQLGYSLTYDSRDDKKIPMSGVMVSLGQDFAGLGGDVRYIRSVAELRVYTPLTESIALANRATGGVITGWGGDDVRLLDTFTRGGDLVRGFAASGLGPRDTASANQDALGGTMFVGVSTALQFAVPLVPKEAGLRAEIFADAGSLFGATKAASALSGVQGGSAQLRSSVGAGLIWDSPIGPLRADYAIPVAKQPFDKTQPFSFGIGGF